MRPDMQQVIIERPRGGRFRDNRKWGKRLAYVPDCDYEGEAKFVSSSASRQYADPKHFSDFLSPLKGFLRKNLGRPWDKVYGELRRGLDTRKVTGMHVFDHLKYMVTTDCFVDENRVVRKSVRGFEVDGFYVHPRTGLLRFQEVPRDREAVKEQLMEELEHEVSIDRTTSYRKLEGNWYLVSHHFYRLDSSNYLPVWDVALRCHVQLRQGLNRVAVRKRQCSHAEIAKILARIEARRKEIRRM